MDYFIETSRDKDRKKFKPVSCTKGTLTTGYESAFSGHLGAMKTEVRITSMGQNYARTSLILPFLCMPKNNQERFCQESTIRVYAIDGYTIQEGSG